MKPIEILLVDDNPGFLESLMGFLADQSALRVIGMASSGQQAIEQIARFAPDLILLDLVMPGMDGLEALRQIKAMPAPSRVVMLTFQDEPGLRTESKAWGADAYVTKSAVAQQLLPVIRGLFSSRSTF